jgi:1-acyl-sn-glycerol-3-phosphate acyltransferase
VLYGLIKAILTPVFRLMFRVRVSGAENIPSDGGLIIAANHQAFCDSLFIPYVVPRRVTFVAKAEYFQAWKTRWFFRAVGQIPMERSGGSRSSQALGEASALLAAGGCIGIYPEGTRPPDERLHRGRTGVARLALASRCPVLPVGVRGTRAVQPVGARMLRPFKTIEIVFGEPLDLAGRYGERVGDPLALRQATDELMWEIRQLSGQQYVDTYASRRAQGAPGAPVALVGAGGGEAAGEGGRGGGQELPERVAAMG